MISLYFIMHLLSVELSLAAISNSLSVVLNFVNLCVCLCVITWNIVAVILMSLEVPMPKHLSDHELVPRCMVILIFILLQGFSCLLCIAISFCVDSIE
jgi:hypothetical protein